MSGFLKTYNADGSLQIDASTRMTRILGMVTLPGSGSGLITHPGFAGGTPTLQPINWFSNAPGALPDITINGDSISWSYLPGGGGGPCSAWIGVW